MKLQCQKLEYEFPVVKEEIDGQIPQAFDRGLQFEDRIYMKVSFIFPFFLVLSMRFFVPLQTCNICHVCSQ